jgi:hypothetical protein
MEKVFIIATLVTFVFALGKFAEMKLMDLEIRPLKDLARETIMVFMSGLTAGLIYFNMNGKLMEFMNTITDTKILPTNMTTEIFTGTPEF